MKNKDKKNRINSFGTAEVFFLIIITCIISLLMGYFIGNKNIHKNNVDATLDEFISIYNDVIENYEGEIDKDKILSGIVDGMMSALGDNYSIFLDSDENNTFYATLDGSYEGIGVEIVNDNDNNIVVAGVFENSPAEEAGIKKYDIIKSIDNVEFLGKDKSEISKYVKDNEKNSYTIVVLRDDEEITFEVKRDLVSLKSVSYKTIEKENRKIGYIYISIFSNNTAPQFKKALDSLEEEKIDSLIIDVRENTGGHLTTVVEMLSYMLSSDKVIYQIEKNEKTKLYYSNGDKDYEKPIVILQNSNSASASELFVSALSEQLNAFIIGETSYGKGTVQELNYLSNGNSYKYTTKKWKTSKGIWINEKGILPNLEVKLNDEYYNNPITENDNQLNSAIEYILENK